MPTFYDQTWGFIGEDHDIGAQGGCEVERSEHRLRMQGRKRFVGPVDERGGRCGRGCGPELKR